MAIMKSESGPPAESHGALLGEIKERIRAAQYAALRAVNRELINLYWDIGRLNDLPAREQIAELLSD